MILETDLIRAALLVKANTNEPREYLRCIHINEKYIEATDGKALFRMEHGNLLVWIFWLSLAKKFPLKQSLPVCTD